MSIQQVLILLILNVTQYEQLKKQKGKEKKAGPIKRKEDVAQSSDGDAARTDVPDGEADKVTALTATIATKDDTKADGK